MGHLPGIDMARAAAMAATLCGITAGCTRSLPGSGGSQAIAEYDGCLVTADSASIDGVAAFQALGDSALRITTSERSLATTVEVPDSITGSFEYHSEQPLIDVLFSLESAHPAGAHTGAYNPLEAYAWPLPTDYTFDRLFSRTANGYLTPIETRRYSWPVVTDEPQWCLAALEVAMADGDTRRYAQTAKVVGNLTSMAADLMQNRHNGLFEGIPRHLASDKAGLPRWAGPTDVFQMLTLAHNAAWHGVARACEVLDSIHDHKRRKAFPIDSDSLGMLIKARFWMPNRGQLSAMLYGFPAYPAQLGVTDNLAQALAVTTGVTSAAMAATIVQRTPVTPAGVATTYPMLTPADTGKPTGNMLLQALWAMACCRSRNTACADMAISGLIVQRLLEISSGKAISYQQPVTTMIGRCLLGMEFGPGGIGFTPYVPQSMPGKKQIRGLRYRDATLDIDIDGTGNTIAAFSIDGKGATPFFDGNLKGHHTVTIALTTANAAERHTPPQVQEEPSVCPTSPEVTWPSERHAEITTPVEDDGHPATANLMVYLDATPEEEIYRHDYTLYDAPALTVAQFVPIDADGHTGFSGAPYCYIPLRQRLNIYATLITKGGSRIIQDKKTSARFVESSRYKNRRLTFDIEAADEGRAMIDIRYINGLGIVNSHRRTAVRALRVNGEDCGLFVFPQLSAAYWNRDLGDDWQQLTAYSNALPANLHKGKNRVEIIYRQPSPVYIAPHSNTLLIEFIRLMPLDGNQQLTFTTKQTRKQP